MAEYHVGDVYTATALFKNAAGVGTNPTTVAIVYQSPDGVETTAAPTSLGAGAYQFLIPATMSGRWSGAFKGTGAVTAAEPFEFYVTRSDILG